MQSICSVQYENNKFWLDIDHGDGKPYQDDLLNNIEIFSDNGQFWIETRTKRQRKFRSVCISAKSPLALLDNVCSF